MAHSNRTAGSSYYDSLVDEMRRAKPEQLGMMSGFAWRDDPKRLAFTLSRYKFVAKMFEGRSSVLEVGCADGFASRIVSQAVGELTAIDIDPDFIMSARATASDRFPIQFQVHDLLVAPVPGQFSGIYSLDVLEHIDPAHEERFLDNLACSLAPHGACIIGIPSLESQAYASHYSKLGHVNCKEQPALRALMERFFHNVFMFSMNDEVVHTGYSRMSHYNIALASERKLSG
jgi:2-polyprenyl-3-methyl-5-hydroxy-6-metoxy-1,4-benzoquinol methylase